MSNPARALHSLFTSWAAAGNATGIDARGFSDRESPAIAEQLRAAGAHLADLELAIDEIKAAGRSVDVFRRMFTDWTFGVYSYPYGWNSSSVNELYRQHYLDVLSLLADTIDSALAITSSADAKQLGELIDQAMDLLSSDDSLSDQLRFYLHNLTQEIQHALADDMILNSFNLKTALERLWVAFYGAAGQSTKDPAKWKDLASKLWWPTASGVLVSLPGLTVQTIQLTQGGS